MNSAGLLRNDIQVVREFGSAHLIMADRHKVLQILLNLVSNAMDALDASGRPDKVMTVGVLAAGEAAVRVVVRDNGVGIPPENLTRIFSHGFTTRNGGHGFGLHSGANAALEMGGSLDVRRDGPGRRGGVYPRVAGSAGKAQP
jgi:two-component system NtrC family sensor kinase